MILPYLQKDNKTTGPRGSKRQLVDDIARAQENVRLKVPKTDDNSTIYDLFEHSDKVRSMGFSESVLTVVANMQEQFLSSRVKSPSQEQDNKRKDHPFTDSSTSSPRSPSSNLIIDSGSQLLPQDIFPPLVPSCLPLENREKVSNETFSNKPQIKSVEPIPDTLRFSRNISPNNFYYHSSAVQGKSQSMSCFLDDSSVECEYKEEMKNKYGWLKRLAEEPHTRSKLGTRNFSISNGVISGSEV